MTDISGNATNIRIARALGKLRVSNLDGGVYYDGEDYEHDPNAMHEAVNTLSDADYNRFCDRLWNMCMGAAGKRGAINASAELRADAFLWTVGG